MKVLHRATHLFAHLFGIQSGKVYTWRECKDWKADGNLMIGFQCSTCGDITDISECRITDTQEIIE